MIDSDIEDSDPTFVFPSFKDEAGEIERVQKHFQIKAPNFVQEFLERARKGQLTKLTYEIWDTLENTNSHSSNILKGGWAAVAKNAEQVQRDWQSLKTKMQAGVPMDAPVIARRGEVFHLVSGNTRLMIARALERRPEVLIVDITDFQ